jgi:hypothetical protein
MRTVTTVPEGGVLVTSIEQASPYSCRSRSRVVFNPMPLAGRSS